MIIAEENTNSQSVGIKDKRTHRNVTTLEIENGFLYIIKINVKVNKLD